MKVMVIPIGVDVQETVPKGLEKRLCVLEIRGRIPTIMAETLLKSDGTFGRVWKFKGTCCHLDSSEKPPEKNWCEH